MRTQSMSDSSEIKGSLTSNVITLSESLYDKSAATRSMAGKLATDVPRGPERSDMVDDSDVRRLEERIEAISREGQLRLELALARIEVSTGRIIEQTSAMRQELQEQRADARSLRSEVRDDIASASAVTRSWGGWIIGTIIVVATLLIAVEFGLQQFWASGVQVGQAMHNGDPVAPQPAPSSQTVTPTKHP